MNRPIDLEHLFHHYAADKLRVAGELDEDAAEALAEKLRWSQLRCAAAVSTPAPIRQNRIQQATTPRRIA